MLLHQFPLASFLNLSACFSPYLHPVTFGLFSPHLQVTISTRGRAAYPLFNSMITEEKTGLSVGALSISADVDKALEEEKPPLKSYLSCIPRRHIRVIGARKKASVRSLDTSVSASQ